MTLQRSGLAAAPRTLVDILLDVVEEFGDHPALDNGVEILTYSEFLAAAETVGSALASVGVRRGDRVGVRIRSGTTDLYVAIAGVLLAGASYVPVDAEDPEERARIVFGEADVTAVLADDLVPVPRAGLAPPAESTVDHDPAPGPEDDAWVIFTSGSTGKPKGVAVTHRNAAAFVDAESRLFLPEAPIGPGDRVMAGLSVGFDASCEEMWLAWAHGGCLVPAPRSLVRSGIDLGPWLIANSITVVSTVPTLLAMWPVEALDRVRLLILGGEACPPEIGERFATTEREVWNTYGPTEATVVASAARLTGEGPVRIGLPLDGWDLAVVGITGEAVEPGGSGELIIGGVGLARYLDPGKDAEKYAPMPSLGWARAYRTGDLVRYETEGLIFLGRADDQIKFGGRRIELGEIDNALLSLDDVTAAAAAVRSTKSGNKVLVGYVSITGSFDPTAALAMLRQELPAALVPRLVGVASIPTRTSGKVDRDALPWPAIALGAGEVVELAGTEAWIKDLWSEILGAEVANARTDFFDLGGSSLTAAQLVTRLRERAAEITVADVYESSRLDKLATLVDGLSGTGNTSDRTVRPVPRKTQIGQAIALVPLRAISGARWVVWIAMACAFGRGLLGLDFLPSAPLGWLLAGWLFLIFPVGRIALTGLGARLILAGIGPGTYPRGGKVHLRVWLAERLAVELGAAGLSGAAFIRWYARAVGGRVGRHVDLHSVPPVTGMLILGDGCAVEAEVDLTGHWLDGDDFHLGRIEIGQDARIGARSLILGGATVQPGAEVAAGSAVLNDVAAGEFWSGAPAIRAARTTRGPWADATPANRPVWVLAYAASSLLIAGLPLIAGLLVAAVFAGPIQAADSRADLVSTALWVIPVATPVALLVLAMLVAVLVRALGHRLEAGHYPVHGATAWAAWTTLKTLDEARTWLFPLYASTLTPTWLRLLGAKIGADVEASTVLMIPKLTQVNDGAFLADDTLLGGYELGGGWFRIDRVLIGKHAFVGNSGMAAPGRKVPKESLVAVLSAAPRRAKAKAGTSWIGSPPTKLRRTADNVDDSRTYSPPTWLRVARAVVELCRLVPVILNIGLWFATGAVLLALAANAGWWVAAVLSGPVLLAAALLAAAVTTAAKWVLVGRVRAGKHPLWSGFVWRNELADTFVEVLAAPWFARPAMGSWILNVWLRSLGATIGRGVWCESYWLPEADLVELRDGATVNQGCVVQTHLFHDRMLRMDKVTLRAGATLGPNSVVLPAATLGKHATVGPVSLVMRGETVPDRTRWTGNPIGPWAEG